MNGISNLFKLLSQREFKYIYAGLRRRFLYYFRTDYVNTQLARRRGACLKDGRCCKITMPWCPYLENGKCAIYERQPLFCKIFPIDEKDKELSDVKERCSYYFE